MDLQHACQRTTEATSLPPIFMHESAYSESSASSSDLSPLVSEAEDDLGAGEAALYIAALHRPVVETAQERDDLGAGEAALYLAALPRPVVETAQERDDLGA